MGRFLWIPNNEFHLGAPVLHIVYDILLLSQGCRSFNQYNLQDVVIEFQSSPVLRWITLCVSKLTCTHVIIISLWFICPIQCRFSIYYLSIPGKATSDRCNISHVFTISFQLQCDPVSFIYLTIVLGGLQFG